MANKGSKLPDGEITLERMSALYLECRDHLRDLVYSLPMPPTGIAEEGMQFLMKHAPHSKIPMSEERFAELMRDKFATVEIDHG